MELTEALRIAQAALLDTPGIVLNRKTGLAHVLPGAADDLYARADAYNLLARHVAALEGCGK
ncbi:hypothetical protein [Cupriavidus pauculus]|uniref:Uncharacterized protein n=1 Tax=Cupriavidus pauculus TaxID=82633 RepID=A0A3G8H3E7_9BURK|nr:hypothetical protein [Cupriavidus pauculus]AZG14944.1 hypothetical protein EHF44_16805 [Cupriavidus pauculus]